MSPFFSFFTINVCFNLIKSWYSSLAGLLFFTPLPLLPSMSSPAQVFWIWLISELHLVTEMNRLLCQQQQKGLLGLMLLSLQVLCLCSTRLLNKEKLSLYIRMPSVHWLISIDCSSMNIRICFFNRRHHDSSQQEEIYVIALTDWNIKQPTVVVNGINY